MTLKKVKRGGSSYKDGLMLSIDPSSGASGSAGFAVFDQGFLVESGDITFNGSTVDKRLRDLVVMMGEEFQDEFEVMVIEELKFNRVSINLKGACFVFKASVDAKNYVEITPSSWQAIAKKLIGWDKDTDKSDEWDAIWIGIASIFVIEGLEPMIKYRSLKKKKELRTLVQRLGSQYDWWGIPELKSKWENMTDEQVKSI